MGAQGTPGEAGDPGPMVRNSNYVSFSHLALSNLSNPASFLIPILLPYCVLSFRRGITIHEQNGLFLEYHYP